MASSEVLQHLLATVTEMFLYLCEEVVITGCKVWIIGWVLRDLSSKNRQLVCVTCAVRGCTFSWRKTTPDVSKLSRLPLIAEQSWERVLQLPAALMVLMKLKMWSTWAHWFTRRAWTNLYIRVGGTKCLNVHGDYVEKKWASWRSSVDICIRVGNKNLLRPTLFFDTP